MTEKHRPNSYRVEVKASPTLDAYRLVYVKGTDPDDARKQAEYGLNPGEVIDDIEELV